MSEGWMDKDAEDVARRFCIADGRDPDEFLTRPNREPLGPRWCVYLPMAYEALVYFRGMRITPSINTMPNEEVAPRELRRALNRWMAAREAMARRTDLKGDLQMELRAAETDIEDALRLCRETGEPLV